MENNSAVTARLKAQIALETLKQKKSIEELSSIFRVPATQIIEWQDQVHQNLHDLFSNDADGSQDVNVFSQPGFFSKEMDSVRETLRTRIQQTQETRSEPLPLKISKIFDRPASQTEPNVSPPTQPQRTSTWPDNFRQKLAELHALNVTGEVLAGIHNQTEALKTALRVMYEQVHVEWGSVYLLNEENILVAQAYYPEKHDRKEPDPRTFRLGEGATGKAAEKRQIIYIPDTSKKSEFKAPQPHDEAKALLCVPMFDNEGVIGVMNFSGEVGKAHFDKGDEEFALTIARMTVVTTKNIQLQKKVRERTEAIQDLLDYTGQGFISFGPSMKIRPEYSKPCMVFFDSELQDQDVVHLLWTGDVAHDARIVFQEVFENPRFFDILKDLLPVEVTTKQRVLAIEYRMIQSRHKEEEHKIMMIMTDVTREKEFAAQIAKEKHNTMVLKVALDREGFLQFLRDTENLFLSTYSLLAWPAREINTTELFRYYHTIKGGSASYGLDRVAESVHSIETTMEVFRSGGGLLTEEYILQLLDETQEVQQILGATLNELNNVIAKDERQNLERIYKIPESRMAAVEKQVLAQLHEASSRQVLTTALNDLRKEPIEKALQSYVMATQRLAKHLGKPINVEVNGKDIRIPYERFERLLSSLIHVIRNAVDHGIEDVDIRKMRGKPLTGNISINVQQTGADFILSISDDGGGMDPETIKKIALEKGLIDTKTANQSSPEAILQMILKPGFTTKKEVTSISGRGVGMDAVNAALQDLDGTIIVKSQLNRGSTFEIRIPC
ncbi:MAG: GAF domain-containing protein [SAR324 cluster bacterium]|nr:GAF domain-containing protein [SAR324 cluster bacterium]